MIDIKRLYKDLENAEFVDVGIAGNSLHFIFKDTETKECFGVKVHSKDIITMDYEEKFANSGGDEK